jgi:hypothetical protein
MLFIFKLGFGSGKTDLWRQKRVEKVHEICVSETAPKTKKDHTKVEWEKKARQQKKSEYGSTNLMEKHTICCKGKATNTHSWIIIKLKRAAPVKRERRSSETTSWAIKQTNEAETGDINNNDERTVSFLFQGFSSIINKKQQKKSAYENMTTENETQSHSLIIVVGAPQSKTELNVKIKLTIESRVRHTEQREKKIRRQQCQSRRLFNKKASKYCVFEA